MNEGSDAHEIKITWLGMKISHALLSIGDSESFHHDFDSDAMTHTGADRCRGFSNRRKGPPGRVGSQEACWEKNKRPINNC